MAELLKTTWDKAYNRGGNKPSASMNALRTMANSHTLECYASYDELAEWTGQSRRACIDQMKIAQDAGWVKLLRKGHGGPKGPNRSNVWRLTFPVTSAETYPSTSAETCPLQGDPQGALQGEITSAETYPSEQSQNSPRVEAHFLPANTAEDQTPEGSGMKAAKGTTPRAENCTSSVSDSRIVNWPGPLHPASDDPVRVETPAEPLGDPTKSEDTEHFTPWPTGKPFVPGEFDPFCNYVDETTGEPITPTPA